MKSSSSSEKEEEEEFVVEKVLQKRRGPKGIEYLLKWQGFPLEEATWEPEKNANCPELIAEFERAQEAKKEKKAKERREREKRTTDKAIDQVLGVTDTPGELHFLIKYKDETAELVPAKEANVLYPQEVIAFYERHMRFV